MELSRVSMQKLERLEDFTPARQPLVLTIGNFDGVHRGHRAVLQKVLSLAGSEGQTAVITFSNHPADVLRPEQSTLLLCTLAHKLHLLETFGIDTLLLLPFTRYLAQHSAASFIERIRRYIPFSHLVLGYDATLGRDRQGDRTTMNNLGDQWGFTVHYIEEFRYEGLPISSTSIRETLQKGDLERVEQLLARPYSMYVVPNQVLNKENKDDCFDISVDVKGLCLPPDGKYEVEIVIQNKRASGFVSLGQVKGAEYSCILRMPFESVNEEFKLSENPFEVIFCSQKSEAKL